MRKQAYLSTRLAGIIFGLISSSISINATPGDLDNTFGIMGQVQDTRMETIHATLVQPDGKILVVGSTQHNPTPSTTVIVPAITRYNADGSLDYGFGNEGWVVADYVSEYGAFYGVTIQSDGKLIAVGTNRPSAFVVRLNNDGTYDTTFSGDGKMTFNFPGANHVTSFLTQVAIIPNSDKILVAGNVEYTYYLNQDCDNTGLARINANGTFDSTFGTAGKRLVDTQESQVSSMAIHPGNKKIALSFTIWVDDFYVMMLNENGTYDTTFSGDGVVQTDINGGHDASNTLAFQRFFINVGGLPAITYKLVVGGIAYGSSSTGFDTALIRYNLNGALDTSFGTNGKVRRALSYQRDEIEDLKIDSQGRIVASGTREWNDQESFAVQRFLSDGSIDNSFGNQGRVYTKIYISGIQVNAEPSGLALAPDGKIVVVSGYYSGEPRMLVRYEP